MIYMHDLNDFQIEIANHLWSLKTSAACQAWIDTLDREMREEVNLVMELMMMAAVDEEVDEMSYYPDAEALIKKVRNSY